jgi:tol-pal system protein YbgF
LLGGDPQPTIFSAMNRHIWGFSMVLLVGCTTPMSALRDENHQLTRTVEELRTDRRAQDRKLKDLQHQLDKLRGDKVTAVMASMPPLPVEVAGPAAPSPSTSSGPSDAPRIVAITDDGTEIVYEGDAALGKAATIEDDVTPAATPAPRRARTSTVPVGSYAAGEGVEISRRPAVSARTARVATRDTTPAVERNDDASAEYRAAVELVKAGNQPEAIDGLRAFLRKYPRHDYADNAQYWLGEAFYAQKDYPHALAEFRTVIETYPRGNKVPDALLKVGYCYQALGQSDKARAVLEQVVNLYPKTEPAALATKRLETP